MDKTSGLTLIEIWEGLSPDDIQACTGTDFKVSHVSEIKMNNLDFFKPWMQLYSLQFYKSVIYHSSELLSQLYKHFIYL